MNPFSKENALKAIALAQLADTTSVASVDNDTFEELKRRTLNAHEDLRSAYEFSGRFLSGLASLEGDLLSLVMHLSREVGGQVSEKKVKKMPASERRKALAQLLPSDWREGKILVLLLADLADLRNQVAHNPLVAFVENNGRIHPGPLIAVAELQDGKFTTSYLPLSDVEQKVQLAILSIVGRVIHMLWLLIAVGFIAGPNARVPEVPVFHDMLQKSGMKPDLDKFEVQVLRRIFPPAEQPESEQK